MLLNSPKSFISIQIVFFIILCTPFQHVFAEDRRIAYTGLNNDRNSQSLDSQPVKKKTSNPQSLNRQSLNSRLLNTQSLDTQSLHSQSLNSQPSDSVRDVLEKFVRREALENGKFGTGFVHFPLVHKYSGLPGSSYRGGSRNESLFGIRSKEHHEMLRRHDRKRHNSKLFDRRRQDGEREDSKGQERKRKGRRLTASGGGADFYLGGNTDPQVAGLYWASIGLGTPSKTYKVQIDTGSDVLWVQCQPCQACASTSNLVTLATPFAPSKSSTSSVVSCTDAVCTELQSVQSTLGLGCSNVDSDDRCYYRLLYGDGSATTGYAINDKIQYTSLSGVASESSISFGCSYNQSGQLLLGQESVDGLLGLGSGSWSLISQLTSQGVIANSFAHCLGGEEYGQGSLILGSVVLDNPLYTPMTDSGHYYIILEGISVDSVRLEGVREESFGSAEERKGVILDSGTTLALVPNEVWDAVVSQVVSRVSVLELLPFSSTDNMYCWDYTDKSLEQLTTIFPNMTLHFKDGADMALDAFNYMVVVQYGTGSRENAACFVWQPANSTSIDITVLGDVVLRDKLIYFDLERNEIAWTNMDCTNGVIKTQNATIVLARQNGAIKTKINPLYFWFFLFFIGFFTFWGTV